MWSNDMKCKYMFMFPLKNLARKELKRYGTRIVVPVMATRGDMPFTTKTQHAAKILYIIQICHHILEVTFFHIQICFIQPICRELTVWVCHSVPQSGHNRPDATASGWLWPGSGMFWYPTDPGHLLAHTIGAWIWHINYGMFWHPANSDYGLVLASSWFQPCSGTLWHISTVMRGVPLTTNYINPLWLMRKLR